MEFQDYCKLLDGAGRHIVGIGLTAFGRISPALVTSNYEIVCYKWGSDLSFLKRFCPIRAVQRDFSPNEVEKLNTQAILKHPGVLRYLQSLGKIAVFSYKHTEWVDRFCQEQGWLLLANPRAIRDQFEDKDAFFTLVRRLGLAPIPGEQWEVEKFTEDDYRRLRKRLGRQLVFQLTSFSEGGGKGTYFINDISDFRTFLEDAKGRLDLSRTQLVNVSRFIDGISGSITGCVTRYGVLTGLVQTQILDVPELVNLRERRGIWRGHDWSFRHYSSAIQKGAERIARNLGEAMAHQGYKGVFGVDLMIDAKSGKVYPNEINPRYTGAFPVYSFLQLQKGEILFDVFQLLEFLDINYTMDFAAVDRSLKAQKEGAHLVLHNKDPERWAEVKGDLKAGVYKLSSKFKVKSEKFGVEWVREGVTPLDIQHPDEFVLTDGVPRRGDLVKPHLRCGKLVFGRTILDGTHNRLNEWARTIVNEVYFRLDLQPVDLP